MVIVNKPLTQEKNMFIWFNAILEEYQYGNWQDYIDMVKANPQCSIHILERMYPKELPTIKAKVGLLNSEYRRRRMNSPFASGS